MRVTKYPQSCLLLEKGNGRILIDPGSFAMEAFTPDDFGDLQAVLYTHRHPDHFAEDAVGEFIERGATVVANEDVAGLVGEDARRVEDGDTLDVAGFSITARDLPHVTLVDGSAGPPNTGFVVDEELFHPGDGMDIEGLEVDFLALPIAGPSISFRDAYVFAERTGARKTVPMHYDMFCADPDLFDHFCDIAEVVSLAPGESTEL